MNVLWKITNICGVNFDSIIKPNFNSIFNKLKKRKWKFKQRQKQNMAKQSKWNAKCIGKCIDMKFKLHYL